MSVLDLIADLRRHGATFQVDGNEVVVDAPEPVLTPDVVQALRQHKPEILDYLSMSLERYFAVLQTAEVLSGDDLPPIPPRWVTETGEGRAEAWDAWWDAVEKQRRVRR